MYSVVTAKFKDTGKPFEYIKNRSYSSAVMNSMLVYITDENADSEKAAQYFLENHNDMDMVAKWVPKAVADKVKNSYK